MSLNDLSCSVMSSLDFIWHLSDCWQWDQMKWPQWWWCTAEMNNKEYWSTAYSSIIGDKVKEEKKKEDSGLDQNFRNRVWLKNKLRRGNCVWRCLRWSLDAFGLFLAYVESAKTNNELNWIVSHWIDLFPFRKWSSLHDHWQIFLFVSLVITQPITTAWCLELLDSDNVEQFKLNRARYILYKRNKNLSKYPHVHGCFLVSWKDNWILRQYSDMTR